VLLASSDEDVDAHFAARLMTEANCEANVQTLAGQEDAQYDAAGRQAY
jgi:hypothetical protein